MKKVSKQIYDEVWDQFRFKIRNELWNIAEENLHDTTYDQIDEYIWGQVIEPITFFWMNL